MRGRRSHFHHKLNLLSRVALFFIAAALICLLFGIDPPGQNAASAERKGSLISWLLLQDKSADGLWHFEKTFSAEPELQPGPIRSFRRVKLAPNALASTMRNAPMEFTPAASERRSVLSLPIADGTFLQFSVVESPIMAPELAARYPQIKTYDAKGIDDPAVTGRFDWMPTGFHGIVLSAKGTVLIEPAALGDIENYIVYFQGDVVGGTGECLVSPEEEAAAIELNARLKNSATNTKVTSGTALRTYRLAAAATAEYTQAYGGGTVQGGLQAITTTINLVNAIYEREVAIRMTLVANNDAAIFTDTTTDGFTHGNVGTLFNESQGRLDAVIGNANYDVGHVFDGLIQGSGFQWSGLGSFNAVCNITSKARGVDFFRNMQPTNIYAYYSAAHEFGHQFNANHTFNTVAGNCANQRTAATAYEPGTGSTIMGYRLNCSPDDLGSTDTYFHNISLEQIVNYTTAGIGNTCGAQTATGNNPPAVAAGPSFTIPMGTPFILTATGSDPNSDAVTFAWEEFDLGAASPPNTDDGSRPIFRSFAPVTSPARMFPRLPDVLSGFASGFESLPTTTRLMNFRVTARDNRTGGGGINSAATQVQVNNGAGPFTVTQPAAGANWATGSSQTVTWTVANTNAAPVSCANVRITLSQDGGLTFPIVLANSTPNDGSEQLTVPGTPSADARIKVEAVGNIFFNISRSFIVSGSSTHTLSVSSTNPNIGVNITVTPLDISGNGDGGTPFTRTYNFNTMVSLTAPSTASGNGFLKWQRDGADFATSLTTQLLMDANHTMRAIYVPPPVIFIEEGTSNAAALDSVTFVRGPFRLLNQHNFSGDQRTRIIFFTSDLGLAQPNASLSVLASGVALPVESVGSLPILAGSYIVVRLPDGLTTGNLSLTVSLGSATSNPVTLPIVP